MTQPRSDQNLPYAFARQHGVILELSAEGPVCAMRPGAPLAALAEVKRIAGPIRYDAVTADVFETRLAAAYRDNASDASGRMAIWPAWPTAPPWWMTFWTNQRMPRSFA